jgi:hypothetical protein
VATLSDEGLVVLQNGYTTTVVFGTFAASGVGPVCWSTVEIAKVSASL